METGECVPAQLSTNQTQFKSLLEPSKMKGKLIPTGGIGAKAGRGEVPTECPSHTVHCPGMNLEYLCPALKVGKTEFELTIQLPWTQLVQDLECLA